MARVAAHGQEVLVQVGFKSGVRWLHGPTVVAANRDNTLAALYEANVPDHLKTSYFLDDVGIYTST